jgi:hypothetical protein
MTLTQDGTPESSQLLEAPVVLTPDQIAAVTAVTVPASETIELCEPIIMGLIYDPPLELVHPVELA